MMRSEVVIFDRPDLVKSAGVNLGSVDTFSDNHLLKQERRD